MKLRKLLNEKWLKEDEPKKFTTDEKKAFLEAVSKFNEIGKSIYRKDGLKDITENLKKMIEQAKQLTLSEGEWFDNVTVSRHLKNMAESMKVFEKTASEIDGLQGRLEHCYEDIGTTLNKYFNINELEEKLDPVGKEDHDVDNDGDKDKSDDYLKNKRDAIDKSMKNESMKMRPLLKEEFDITPDIISNASRVVEYIKRKILRETDSDIKKTLSKDLKTWEAIYNHLKNNDKKQARATAKRMDTYARDYIFPAVIGGRNNKEALLNVLGFELR